MYKVKELQSEFKKSREELAQSLGELDFEAKLAELEACQQQIKASDFWQKNPAKAQKISRTKAQLEKLLQPWQKLQVDLDDLSDLLNDLASKQPSVEELTEIGELYQTYLADFKRLKRPVQVAGSYDDYEVILSIFAGAGGKDAQDWAQMLLRMYSRWAEKQQIKTELISQSISDDGGLKSVSLYLHQSGLYGRLKFEHGVHRLVRQSPFNALNLRQTSFARIEIMPALEKSSEIVLDEADLRFDFYRSSGHGGQSVNKTDSAVRVTHLPTKLAIAIQNERSQQQNKELALIVLRSRLAKLKSEQRTQTLSELKGVNLANEWGSQIRNYVLHPYKQVKDLRTQFTTSDVQKILDGYLDDFINV